MADNINSIDSTDIADHLGDSLEFNHVGHDGKSLYTTAVRGETPRDGYLYRSMSTEEARQWFTQDWVPTTSGIPWSTNSEYSKKYLHGNCDIQLEVPASDLLTRYRTMGASPKAEGSLYPGDDAETWSTGPFSEVGRKPSADANKLLMEAYQNNKGQFPKDQQDLKKKDFTNPSKGKTIQNFLFTREFKSALMQNGRVVARRK